MKHLRNPENNSVWNAESDLRILIFESKIPKIFWKEMSLMEMMKSGPHRGRKGQRLDGVRSEIFRILPTGLKGYERKCHTPTNILVAPMTQTTYKKYCVFPRDFRYKK